MSRVLSWVLMPRCACNAADGTAAAACLRHRMLPGAFIGAFAEADGLKHSHTYMQMAHLLGTRADLFAPGVVVRVARGWAGIKLQGLWARISGGGGTAGGSSGSGGGGRGNHTAGQAPKAGGAIARVL